MARAAYLADASAFARLAKSTVRAASPRSSPRVPSPSVRPSCSSWVTALGSLADHQAIPDRFDAFERVPVTDGDHRRAIELERLLAERGHHRALSLVDALSLP